jgi:hypothetical protein
MDVNPAVIGSLTLGGPSGSQSLTTAGFSLDVSGSVQIGANGSVTVAVTDSLVVGGTLTNLGQLTVSQGTIDGDVDNRGALDIVGNGTLTAGLTTNASSVIRVDGAGGGGSFNLLLVQNAGTVTNNGVIELRNSGASIGTAIILGGNTLVNEVGATIRAVAGTNNYRSLSSTVLDNRGTLDIDTRMVLTGGANLDHVNSGTITITNGSLETQFTSAPGGSFTNTASGVIDLQSAGATNGLAPVSTSSAAGSFTNQGSITLGAGVPLLIRGSTSFDNSGTLSVADTAFVEPTGSFVNTGTVELAGTSWTGDLDNRGTLDLVSASSLSGQLIVPAGPTGVTTGSSGGALTVGGVNVDGATFDNVPLVVSQGAITAFDNVTFQNMDPSDTQLTVVHDGNGGPFVFDGVNFDLLTGVDPGFYVSATDSDGTDNLVISLTNSVPADGSAFEQELSGAVIDW